jgi:AraC family transcriptional regulator
MDLQPTIITKPAFSVVGLLLHTQPMSPDIPALWDKFVPRMAEIPHPAAEHASYGLMGRFDPATGMFDYMAGNLVTQVDQLPASMSRWDIAASTYAVLETTMTGIGETMDYLQRTWLPASEYDPSDAPSFERYGEAFSPDNPVLEIYVPVHKNNNLRRRP